MHTYTHRCIDVHTFTDIFIRTGMDIHGVYTQWHVIVGLYYRWRVCASRVQEEQEWKEKEEPLPGSSS